MSNELGKNAQSFSDHICAGLQAGGLDPEDYPMSVVADNATGETGFLMSQVPISEKRTGHEDCAMCEEHTLEASEPIVCYEDRIEWPMEKDAGLLPINEQQPASICAVTFLGAMLTGGSIPARSGCEECEE